MRNSPPLQHAVETVAPHSPSDHASNQPSRRRDADRAWQPAVRKPKPRNLVAIEERLVVQPLRDATLRQSGWLWPGRIPVGELTLVAGYPGVGKSSLALDLAARVSVGAPWPDQPGSTQPPGDVLLVVGEENGDQSLRDRLTASGADLNRILILSRLEEFDPETGELQSRPFSLSTDTPHLETLAELHPGVRLVIFDPITHFCNGAENNAHVLRLLLALGQFAARAKVAVVAVTQFRKDATGPKALRAIGSQAYAAVPRAVWSVNPPSTERQGRRQLAPIKLNLQAEATALDFDVIAGRVVWQETPTPFDCHPTTESRTEREERQEKSAVKQAAEWLRRALADEDRPATMIQKEAKEAGFAWRTVLRAKEEAGVR